MEERTGIVTMKGNPVTLLGREIKEGDKAPDVELTATDLSAARLSDYRGKILVISSVPSLDTPVCDMETRRFNTEAASLGSLRRPDPGGAAAGQGLVRGRPRRRGPVCSDREGDRQRT